MSSNDFCRHLSNGYRIYIDNTAVKWAPCCYWTDEPMEFSNLTEKRKTINIATPWQHNACQKCRREEEYKPGYRLAGLKKIPAGIPDTKAVWVDIQADNTCNGGCLICGPWSSSYWQSELAKRNEYVIQKSTVDIEASVDKIFSTLDTSEIRLLQFLGGEPFLSDTDSIAIAKLPNTENCDLKYTTNGSVYPQQHRIDQWKKFKSVMLNFSIDGLGKHFEYLRYPLKWDKVEANIKRLIDETDDSVKFHINHSLTPFNIFYHREFLEWVDATFPKDRFTGIHVHSAYGTMCVSSSSDKLRQAVSDKYGEDHNLSKMLRDNPRTNVHQFWGYIRLWDQRRSQDWKTVFPEIVEFFR